MPIMDGYACAKELSTRIFVENPESKCPIIACTANVSPSDV